MSSQRAAAGARTPAHEARVRTLFDTKAAGWPDKYASGGRLAGRLDQFAAAVEELGVPGGQVLDLGCGSGELGRCLAAAGYQVTGCDIAPQMLRQAAAADREHSVRWLQLRPGWRVLPVETDSLDVVLASSVLEYLRSPGYVLVECVRVLRPGGVLLCTVPSPAHPVRWLEWPLREAARTPLTRAAGRAGPRFAQYASYLRATSQPHSARWWQAAAVRSGLAPATELRPDRGPLRLLAFRRTAGAAGPSAGSQPVHSLGEHS